MGFIELENNNIYSILVPEAWPKGPQAELAFLAMQLSQRATQTALGQGGAGLGLKLW